MNDGYLGLSIDGTSLWVAIPAVSLISICLIIQLTMGWMACRQLMNNKRVQTPFKISFAAALVFACTMTVTWIMESPILSSSWDTTAVVTFTSLFFLCMSSFYSCILAVLVLRLRVVFRDFMAMSHRTYLGFKCLFVALFAIGLVGGAVFAIEADYSNDSWTLDHYPDWVYHLFYALNFAFLILYLIGVACAVSFFLNNLRKVALAQIPSPRNLEAQTTEDIPLNDQQQRIIHLASRYALLFLIAVSSDLLIACLFQAAVSMESRIRSVFFTIDLTINLLCIYLQFAFAGEQYMRCCGCIHRRWRKRVDTIMRRAIRKHSIELSGKHSFSTSTEPAI